VNQPVLVLPPDRWPSVGSETITSRLLYAFPILTDLMANQAGQGEHAAPKEIRVQADYRG
jgi:hypothetical protein